LNINSKIKVLPILRELNVSGCDSLEEIDCAENDGINLANILNCKFLILIKKKKKNWTSTLNLID
jgi:hypothetical protein